MFTVFAILCFGKPYALLFSSQEALLHSAALAVLHAMYETEYSVTGTGWKHSTFTVNEILLWCKQSTLVVHVPTVSGDLHLSQYGLEAWPIQYK